MTTNHAQESGESEIRRQTLLQAADISHSLVRKVLEQKSLTAKDVEQACGHGREMMEKLGKLRLALLGVEVE